jgi:outer membrane biosynthesis protein TonB
MAETANRLESLRLNRRETGRLGLALALSLAAHLVAFGGYELSRQLHLFPSLHRLTSKLAFIPPPAQNREQPMEFVMVEQPSTEAPQNAKYYSSQNSRAANPDASRDLNIPQLNGKQTDVPKTENVPKPDFNKLQPAPKPVNREPAQPAPAVVEPGDLTLGKPENSQQQQEQTPPRPRTIQEALAQMQSHRSPGVEMKENGGVNRRLETSLFDVKATPFGAYDQRFIEAVTQRWYDLLDSQQFALDRTGKVALRFHLNYDGTVTEMTVLQNTVGVLLGHVCEDAIHDPAPYAAWPEDMRHLVGANYREITFTFYYY